MTTRRTMTIRKVNGSGDIMIYCCKDCVAPKRYPGCHDHCPEYIADKARHDKEKAIADQKRYIKNGLAAQTFVGVSRANKARNKLKGRRK